MGTIELWLGPAGCGKTGKALRLLRDEMARGWAGVRYLVPTVGHKRSIEYLLLSDPARQGLLGDPVTTFFNFAEEVASQAQLHGRKLSELQKHLLLKKLARETPLQYFERARRFPGFVLSLSEIIDELKVHMVWPEKLHAAAQVAETRGAGEFARKIAELGALYQGYQDWVKKENLYDNEGIMWTSAVLLGERPALLPELRCLILDGFARLTPIQVEFIRLLAPRLQRTVILFDYEEHRSVSYHPVEDSLTALERADAGGAPACERRVLCAAPRRATALECLRAEVFRERRQTCPHDDSLGLLVGATPVHEAELIAREVRALLRAGKLPDGTPVGVGDIAILARNADQVRERLARTFQRFGLPMQGEPTALAHTPVGRAVLAALRLVRDGWKREDLLTLLKGGFLPIDPALAFQVDITARTTYLRDGRATWREHWPDDDTRDTLREALAPLLALDETYRRRGASSVSLLEAVETLLAGVRARGLPAVPPLPDEQPLEAARYAARDAAFTGIARVFDALRSLGALLGGFRHEEMIELITTALLRENLPDASNEGIPVLSVHATGGQKFPVVFLCHLLQGAFPHHQRESAFLLDHEREDNLRDLHIIIETRKHLEDDEQYWFLHALSSATQRLIFSYAQHDAEGGALERSLFLDEAERLVPGLAAAARHTSFRDVVPPIAEAESAEELLAGLALGLRTARSPAAHARIVDAYTACQPSYGAQLAALFRAAERPGAQLTAAAVCATLAARTRAYSASELQAYDHCPFRWFGGSCLGVQPVSEEFSPLDRGQILHAVLEKLYRDHQPRRGEPVHLEGYELADLWPAVEADLRQRLADEPRFANRAPFLRDIEWDSLCRLLRRFLTAEIERAQTRHTHPAYFEHHFGSRGHAPLLLGGTVPVRGIIDRIDLVDDDLSHAIVIDYKSTTAMTLPDLLAGKIVQAPIYALALARLTTLTPLGVEFMGLKKAAAKGLYRQDAAALYPETKGMKQLTTESWRTFLAENEARLTAEVHQLTAGQIPLAPTTKTCPDQCDFFLLCRGEKFALERMVREGKDGGNTGNVDG